MEFRLNSRNHGSKGGLFASSNGRLKSLPATPNTTSFGSQFVGVIPERHKFLFPKQTNGLPKSCLFSRRVLVSGVQSMPSIRLFASFKSNCPINQLFHERPQP